MPSAKRELKILWCLAAAPGGRTRDGIASHINYPASHRLTEYLLRLICRNEVTRHGAGVCRVTEKGRERLRAASEPPAGGAA